MKPAETEQTNFTFKLPGGTEENDLPVCMTHDTDNNPVILSTWVPTDDERKAIAAGANIELREWGTRPAPVSIGVNVDEIIRVVPG